MSRACELVVTTGDGQIVAGTLTEDNGKIASHPMPGYETLCDNVLAGSHIVEGGRRQITADDDPQEWFRNLPREYSGSYLRARILDENKVDSRHIHVAYRPTG